MECSGLAEWRRVISNAEGDLRRIEASRPKVRRTSARFESEQERAQHELSWAKSWLKDHVEKCAECNAKRITVANAY